MVNLEDMNRLSATYIVHLAPVAVNLPASAVHTFYHVMEQMEVAAGQTLPFHHLDELKREVIRNNLDTFYRLQQTQVFKNWKATKDLQQEMHVI